MEQPPGTYTPCEVHRGGGDMGGVGKEEGERRAFHHKLKKSLYGVFGFMGRISLIIRI